MPDLNENITPDQTLMYQEASYAGQAVRNFLGANNAKIVELAKYINENDIRLIVTCARGSSDNAATYGKYLFETMLRKPTSSAALSVSSIYDTVIDARQSICIAISQSGKSPDLLNSVESYRKGGAYIVALVNDEESPLAKLADCTLGLKAGAEISVAATKSFIVSMVGLAAITAHTVGDDEMIAKIAELPDLLDDAFGLDWSGAIPVLENATSAFIIARVFGFSIAQEAALKLKETCGIHAEAFSAAEVRHGPMAIVKNGFPVFAFAGFNDCAAGESVREAAYEFAGRGAKVVLAGYNTERETITENITGLSAIRTMPELNPILLISSFYKMANQLAIKRGLNPDKPPYLNKVTKTV